MKINYLWILTCLTMFCLTISCNNNSYKVDLSSVDKINPDIFRYDIDLQNIDTSDFVNELIQLSDKYHNFLGALKEDTTGIFYIKDFITDSSTILLINDCHKIFPENYKNKEFSKAFQHLKYYMPNITTPKIYMYVSGLDYEYPVIYNDGSLFIAIDMYLGKDYKNYLSIGLPMYKICRFDKGYLVRDCMFQIADSCNIDEYNCTKLIDWMIYYGKNIEFTKRMIPNIADTILFGYTEAQLKWCEKNITEIWKYIISDNKLYSTDISFIHKMIDDGPFTSFLSHESPAGLGKWIGWKIVSNYMKNNDVTLSDLMKDNDIQEILIQSHFRP